MTRRFTDDERRWAVEQVESGEMTASQVAGSLDITVGTVTRWRRRFADNGAPTGREISASDASKGQYPQSPGDREPEQPSPSDLGKSLPRVGTAALFPRIDYDKLFPRVDTAALFPKIDYDKLFPRVDTAALFPKIDYDKLFPKVDTAALFPKIDYDKLFPKPDFTKLRDWAEELRQRWWPPNWPVQMPDLDVLNEILNEDGIPLVWVPRASIVERLLSAADRSERIGVLLEQRDLVILDCEETTSDLQHHRTSGAAPLARAAISALAGRHPEAAQALAVVVTESALKVALAKSYTKISQEVRIDAREVGIRTLRYRAALAPVARFYTPYYESVGDRPDALSRHVSVHYAEADHYTEGNALLAVLLMTSVLRALDDFWSRVEPPDGEEAVVTL